MSYQLEHLNQANLIGFIRHELRTPINAIIGYGELLQEDLDETNSSALVIIDEVLLGVKEVLQIISDLLNPRNEDEEYKFDLEDSIKKIPLVMGNLAKKIITHSEDLLNNLTEVESKEDAEKIRIAASKLFELVNHADSMIDTFIQSLDLNQLSFDSLAALSTALPNSDGETENLDTLTGKILVVDDTPSNLELLSRNLSRKGHQVTTNLSVKQAIETLSNSDYDLILLDLIMPEINGYQFLNYLKNNPSFQHIPVIMISALDELESVIRCIEIGAEDFLPKPFNPVLLNARINSSLERKRLRDKEQQYTQQVEALSRILEKELDKGRQMQKDFLPARILSKSGWEFDAFFSPARQLAGDFYDIFELPNNHVGLVIADVCDKGVGAALFMGLFRSLIRIFSGQTTLDGLSILAFQDNSNSGISGKALEAIRLANNYVSINHAETGMFATIFFGVIELETGKMEYVSGGHEAIYILDANHQIKHTLDSTGPAVGMLPNMTFQIKQIEMDAGDLLVAYTDGVPEAKSENGEFFNNERLRAALHTSSISAQETIQYISNQVMDHIGMADQFDDITMLAAKRL